MNANFRKTKGKSTQDLDNLGSAPCRADRGPQPELETPGPCWTSSGPLGVSVGAIPANHRWYQKSVEPYAYLPMSGRHRPTDTFAGGDWHCGRWAECC